MLLLLSIGAAALLSVELRVAQASVAMARARMNAMAGALIALGELQRMLGPDQRVSATAEILCDPAQTDPTQTDYYANPTNGTVIHPHWVGVWNSGRTNDPALTAVSPADTQDYKVIYRTTSGGLRDARFASDQQADAGSDAWSRARAGASPTAGTTTKRLLGWLVSGNEAIAGADPGTITPFTAIDKTLDIVALGGGTLGGTLFNGNTSSGDMLACRVRTVPITDATGNRSGHYAYWVADEGVKARFNIRDKYAVAGIRPTANTPGNGGLAKFLVSQTANVDAASVKSLISDAPTLPDIVYSSTGPRWDLTSSFADLPLVSDNTVSVASAVRYAAYYFHDFSFVSAGVDCDVENGGLKKDLSAFMKNGVDISDYAGVVGSGLKAVSPLLPQDNPTDATAEPTLSPVFPTFGQVYNWWNKAPTYAGTCASVPPSTVPVSYNQKTTLHGAVTTGGPYSFGTPTLKTGATSAAPMTPLVTQMTMYFKPVLDTSGGLGASTQVRCMYYPQVVLWNPYPVSISLSAPTVEWFNDYVVYMKVLNGGVSPEVYVGIHPHLNFKLPVITLKPGQSVSFVADTGSNPLPAAGAPVNASTAYSDRTVIMRQGLPTPSNYFVDSLCPQLVQNPYSTTSALFPSGGALSIPSVCVCLGYGKGGTEFTPALFNETSLAINQVVLKDSNTTLSHLKLDPYNTAAASIALSDARFYGTKLLEAQWVNGTQISTLATETSPSATVPGTFCFGFRMKRLDSSESKSTGAAGASARGLTVNPFVDMNVRAARQARSPFDAQDMISQPTTFQVSFAGGDTPPLYTFNGQYSGGIRTEDYSASMTMGGILAPAAADKVMPFYASSKASSSSYPGCIPFDVPYADVGLLSLGQLCSAPLNGMSYGPSMPFASGRVPLAANSLSMTATTVPASPAAPWAAIANGWGQPATSAEQLRQLSQIGGNTTDICDIAYELNHALWDSCRISGISPDNNGWTLSSGKWSDNVPDGSASHPQTLPSSRYSAGTAFPHDAGFFSSDAYKLYHASYTLLEKGAFNVNSTSRVAWIALLTSCRGLALPTIENTAGVNAGTPFPRLLHPKSGPVSAGASPFIENVWSGYRALSDAEVGTLADKIVAEVKKRGPFLSLSDFINRRLKTPSPGDLSAANWTQREGDYLGTLEAAITNAHINDGATAAAPAGAAMDRTGTDTFVATTQLARQTPGTPQFRSASLTAGTPGYLQQSDILRSVGNALTARSDTFTVRAYGESDGAIAWVSITVQREPAPVVPGDGSYVLPVNPKAISSTSKYAGNQFFGRRMRVVATRWLSSGDI